MSLNHVALSGNLTRDPVLRRTASGGAVLNFGIAVNERRHNKQTDEWEDYTHFVDCVMFGRRAESLAQYLTKGTKVAIEGKLNYSSWDDKDGGGRRSKLEVVVNELEFMSARKEGQAPAAQPNAEEAVAQTFAGAEVSEVPTSAYSDDDIDF